jgi:hypothetical protein
MYILKTTTNYALQQGLQVRMVLGIGFVQLLNFGIRDRPFDVSPPTYLHTIIPHAIILSRYHCWPNFSCLTPHFHLQDAICEPIGTPAALNCREGFVCRIVSYVETINLVVVEVSVQNLKGKLVEI